MFERAHHTFSRSWDETLLLQSVVLDVLRVLARAHRRMFESSILQIRGSIVQIQIGISEVYTFVFKINNWMCGETWTINFLMDFESVKQAVENA